MRTYLWPLLLGISGVSVAADNMTFDGTLRAHACTLNAADRSISLPLGTTGTRDLYLGRWPAAKEINLRLENCDPRVSDTVRVAFTGKESSDYAGALSPDGGSPAKGIVIVIEDADRNAIMLNGQPWAAKIGSADQTLRFYSQLRGEPDAIANRGIIPGSYTATAQFTLTYP